MRAIAKISSSFTIVIALTFWGIILKITLFGVDNGWLSPLNLGLTDLNLSKLSKPFSLCLYILSSLLSFLCSLFFSVLFLFFLFFFLSYLYFRIHPSIQLSRKFKNFIYPGMCEVSARIEKVENFPIWK